MTIHTKLPETETQAPEATSEPALSKAACVFDESSGTWSNRFTGVGLENKPVEAVISREHNTARVVEGHLLKAGFALPNDPGQRRDLIDRALAAKAPVQHRAAQPGWYDDGNVFVESDRIIGSSPSGKTILPPQRNPREISARRKRRGKRAAFTTKLAKFMRHSSLLIFVVCAVFAAALLARQNRGCVGFVMYGRSRTGKSTALLYGASLLGFGDESELLSLNASRPGLLAAARNLNDHLTPINEVGTANGTKTDIYRPLRELTYQFMEGQDIVRHPAWTGDSGVASSSFRSIFVLTSEHSPDEWAAISGLERDPGERARLIGIPVARQASSIFDKPPRKLEGEALLAWTRKQFATIRKRVKLYRGHGFSLFVKYLIENSSEKWLAVEKYKTRFLRNFGAEGLDPIEMQIVEYFAILYAAGALASDAGIIPLSHKQIGQALIKCARDAIRAIPDPEKELRRAVTRFRKKISKEFNMEDKTKGKQKIVSTHDGFVRRDGTRLEIVIRASAYVGWARNRVRAQDVLKWCEKKGFLKGAKAAPGASRGLAWAESQPTWPDSTRPRSIQLLLPNGLSDLKVPRRAR